MLFVQKVILLHNHHHHGLTLKVKLVRPYLHYTVSNITTRNGKYTGRNVEGTVVSWFDLVPHLST